MCKLIVVCCGDCGGGGGVKVGGDGDGVELEVDRSEDDDEGSNDDDIDKFIILKSTLSNGMKRRDDNNTSPMKFLFLIIGDSLEIRQGNKLPKTALQKPALNPVNTSNPRS